MASFIYSKFKFKFEFESLVNHNHKLRYCTLFYKLCTAEVSVLYLSSHAILASNERRQARLVRSLRRTLLSAAKAGSLSALRLLRSPGLLEHPTALPSNQCAQAPPAAPVDTGTGIGTGLCEPARLLTREQHEVEESEQSARETEPEREREPERAVILTPADMHNASELLTSAKQPNSLLASGHCTPRLGSVRALHSFCFSHVSSFHGTLFEFCCVHDNSSNVILSHVRFYSSTIYLVTKFMLILYLCDSYRPPGRSHSQSRSFR